MKKLLSLALVLTMLFTIIAVPSVSAAVVTDATADAEGFKTVYLFGYENGNTEPTGGGSNFFTNVATPVTEGDATKSDNLESVVTYAEAGIDKPVSPVGEDFGDMVHHFDYSNGGKQTVTTCRARIGNIKNQITFESGATYRASFWIRIDDTSIDGDYAYLSSPYLCIGNSTSATSKIDEPIAQATMGDRVIKRGQWTKVGMTFTANDSLVTAATASGWGIRWNMNSDTYGTTVKGYIDNFKLEKLDTRTRAVEPNYVYYEGFDNAVTGGAMSSNPYYATYFTPSYPKPTDAATEPTWKTRAKIVKHGGGSPTFGVKGTYSYSGGSSLLTSLGTAAESGGNYISDIFHGDFTSDDIGRRFKISAKVYPVSANAETAPANGGASAHFYIALGGSDGIGDENYGNAYRSFGVAGAGKDMEWDKWNDISTTFAVTEDYVCQTSVTDAEVATTNAYKAVNALRINQSGSENITTEFYTDDYLVKELKKYTISATSNDTTMGTAAGGGECWEDKSITLTATANDGYIFLGWYNGETLVSSDATLTITNPTSNAAYVAKFEKELGAEYTDEVYYYNFEDDDTGSTNTWYKGYKDAAAETAGTVTNLNADFGIVTWTDAIADGIAMPEGGIEQFGKQLYKTDATDKEILSELAGRFNGWEKTAADSKYVSGRHYKFTMWVYPVSYQVRNDGEAPATASLYISHEQKSGADYKTGIDWTFPELKLDQWTMLEWEFTANDKMANDLIPGIYYKWSGTKNTTEDSDNNGKYTIINKAYYDNIRITEVDEWHFGDTAEPTGWVARGGKNGLDTAFHGITYNKDGEPQYTYNRSILHTETYDTVGVSKPSDTCGDNVFVFDVMRPNVVEADYNPIEGSIFWPEDGEKMSYEDAYNAYVRYETLTGDFAGRFNNIVAKNYLEVGRTYKISLKVYVAEKRNIKEEDCPVTTDATNVTIIGTHTGGVAVGDGREVSKSVPYQDWTEVSYLFKATEEGLAYAPSLRINVCPEKNLNSFPTLVYVDDIMLETAEADDLILEVTEDETTVTATATALAIKEENVSSINAIVIIAAYDADGKLISVSTSTEGTVAVKGTISAEYTKVPEASKYVAFLWDNLTNVRPYTLPVEISVVTE